MKLVVAVWTRANDYKVEILNLIVMQEQENRQVWMAKLELVILRLKVTSKTLSLPFIGAYTIADESNFKF